MSLGAVGRALIASLLLTPAVAAQDLTQHHVYTHAGVDVADRFGSSITTIGDLDGDGASEFAVASTRSLVQGPGRVTLFDGATGAIVGVVYGTPQAKGLSAEFGAAVALLPDIDGDRSPDLAVGAPLDFTDGRLAGAVEVRRIPTGELLVRIPGIELGKVGATLASSDVDGDGQLDLIVGAPGVDRVAAFTSAWLAAEAQGANPAGNGAVWSVAGGARFGSTLEPIGDLTGDGVAEIAVGAPADDGEPGAHTGSVTILSGATGGVVTRLEGEATGDGFGSALARLDSLDGDGLDELAIGAPGAAGRRGTVEVVRGAFLASGAGPQSWTTMVGLQPEDLFGSALEALQLEVPALAVAAPRSDSTSGVGEVVVRSALDGAELFAVPESTPNQWGGAALEALPLVAQGADELLIGAPVDDVAELGLVRTFSLDRLTLAGDRHRIEVGEGGTLTLSIDAAPANAGNFYLLLGTSSGTSPGIPTTAGVLPLQFDSYSLLTLSGMPGMAGFQGFLDASGQAAASLSIAPDLSFVYAPFQLHFGVGVIDLAEPGLVVTEISHAVPLGFDLDACTTNDPAEDCNGNGIVDACELSDGTATDCDGDGVLDACQLDQPGADVDHDGVLDACRTVVFVDADASGAGDGSSWADAFTELADALIAAPEWAEVWVAEGTYAPSGAPFDPQATFRIEGGTALFGGFSGIEVHRDERDWIAHPTILSGDQAGDDQSPGGTPNDNAWNVLTLPAHAGPAARVEGFTIERGAARHLPGCDGFSPLSHGCRGGGMNCLGAPTFRDCVFRDNWSAGPGGAAYVDGDATFVRCLFENNEAQDGGAVLVDLGASPRFVSCRFLGNQAERGGAIAARGAFGDQLWFENGELVGNRALDRGGAFYLERVELRLAQSTVAGNQADLGQGGIGGDDQATLIASSSILWGNSASTGALFEQQVGVASTLEYVCVEGGTGAGLGTGSFAADPLFVALPGPDGQAGTDDDDLRLSAGSPCIDAGDGVGLSLDLADLDGDGVTAEPLPFDVAGLDRVADDPSTVDVGTPAGSGAVVDVGAHERP